MAPIRVPDDVITSCCLCPYRYVPMFHCFDLCTRAMSTDDDSPPTPGREGESSPGPQADGEDRDLQNAGAKGTTTVPQTPPFDWHFAFGPQQLHWARIGHSWTVRLPNAKTWSDVGIRHPHWIAFKHTTGFLVGGEDEEGESQIVNFSDNDHSEFDVGKYNLL